jgi:hypothetical protein
LAAGFYDISNLGMVGIASTSVNLGVYCDIFEYHHLSKPSIP